MDGAVLGTHFYQIEINKPRWLKIALRTIWTLWSFKKRTDFYEIYINNIKKITEKIFSKNFINNNYLNSNSNKICNFNRE